MKEKTALKKTALKKTVLKERENRPKEVTRSEAPIDDPTTTRPSAWDVFRRTHIEAYIPDIHRIYIGASQKKMC